MTWMQMASVLVASVVTPFVVNAIKTKAMDGNVARWVAIGVSIVAGIIAGFAGGMPTTPQAWLTCVFAAIGGVQVAYSAFKAVGITDKWLDSLQAIGSAEGKHTTENE